MSLLQVAAAWALLADTVYRPGQPHALHRTYAARATLQCPLLVLPHGPTRTCKRLAKKNGVHPVRSSLGGDVHMAGTLLMRVPAERVQISGLSPFCAILCVSIGQRPPECTLLQPCAVTLPNGAVLAFCCHATSYCSSYAPIGVQGACRACTRPRRANADAALRMCTCTITRAPKWWMMLCWCQHLWCQATCWGTGTGRRQRAGTCRALATAARGRRHGHRARRCCRAVVTRAVTNTMLVVFLPFVA